MFNRSTKLPSDPGEVSDRRDAARRETEGLYSSGQSSSSLRTKVKEIVGFSPISKASRSKMKSELFL